jgi:dihydroxy-acid dehydratase
VSGSINAIKHLQATAIEAENGLDIFKLWEEMADVPGALGGAPDGRRCGSSSSRTPAARARCSSGSKARIDTSALTCTGKTPG